MIAAVEINETWRTRINRLNHGTADLIHQPTDDDVAAIIEKHCGTSEVTK